MKPVPEKGKTDHLSKVLNVGNIVARMLVQRDISTFDEAKSFFRPELSGLHDPFLMKDMDRAVVRIEKALSQKEKVLVYGDYDVDGTSAVALVYSYFVLECLVPDSCIFFYIPDRETEGYGISEKGIDYAFENGITLIIALDCGIKSNQRVEYARAKGIDFIICDHHTAGDVIPAATAVLDPKRKDCTYPYKELSGCGIGFKLVQAHFASGKKQEANKEVFPSALEKYLDLVAISIASDIVPITGENRILAFFGLKRINENPRKGIKALLGAAQFKKKELSVTDLVFVIGPRINAAGRIEHGKKAVELLISGDDSVAGIAGKSINETNDQRKELDKSITLQALQMIEGDPVTFHKNKRSTVLFNPEWHKGVIGIVASRLIEKYYRPTILLTQANGMAVGSARSVNGFDIYSAIDACGGLVEQFGGHKYAAGLTMKIENIKAFSEEFERIVSAKITEEMLVPEILIESEINFSDITPKFYRILKQFAPFGPENMKPLFVTHNVTDSGFSRVVGENHLKLDLVQPAEKKVPGKNASRFGAIAFQLGEFYPGISGKKPFSICYSIEEKEWNGKTSLELVVKDIKLH